jgi:hypothetical protein
MFLHTKGRGHAVDELDQNCKILASGYRCGVLDADPTCEPWTIPYNTPGLKPTEDFCHYENHNQVCETNACIVETNFINSLSELVENQVQIDSLQYGHAAGFDDSVCKPEKTTADLSGFEQVEELEKHQACCGRYPERYLYKTSGSTQCCDSEVYKTEKFNCCNGEVVLLDEVCEARVSPCASSPCGNGVCEDTADMLDYRCVCDKNFIGKDCVIAQVCHLPELYSDVGFISPCLNDGLCVDLEEDEDPLGRIFDGRSTLIINTNFVCVCTDGFTGQNCEEVVEPDTEEPTIEAPTTEAPITEEPITEEPVTEAPTTTAPTTEVPTCSEPFPVYGPNCDLEPEKFTQGSCEGRDTDPDGLDSCTCDGVGVKNGVAFNDIPNMDFFFCNTAGNTCFCYHYVV